MSKTQRLAAFFIIVGPELAPELMKQLRDPEIEDVAREMASMNVVDFKLQEKNKENINTANLLATTTEHDRFDHYTAEERREN